MGSPTGKGVYPKKNSGHFYHESTRQSADGEANDPRGRTTWESGRGDEKTRW